MKFVSVFVAAAVLATVAMAAWIYGTFNVTTNEQTPGGFTQQTVGESKAGRSQDMPAGEASDRADTTETGRRAQTLTGTGSGDMPLLPEQSARLREYFRSNPARQNDDTFGIAIGASVPRQVALEPLPPELADVMGKYQGDEYVLVKGRLIVVEPKARRIVAIIPVA
jgi:Protein of unknown function (DUF1236)